jgi:hypothetical protein
MVTVMVNILPVRSVRSLIAGSDSVRGSGDNSGTGANVGKSENIKVMISMIDT